MHSFLLMRGVVTPLSLPFSHTHFPWLGLNKVECGGTTLRIFPFAMVHTLGNVRGCVLLARLKNGPVAKLNNLLNRFVCS
jgi:hypothetical protein